MPRTFNEALSGLPLQEQREKLLTAILPFVDIVSIHTDALWGGSYQWLEQASKEAKKHKVQVLAKGFGCSIPHIHRAYASGADFLMSVGWHPNDRYKDVDNHAKIRKGETDMSHVWHEPDTYTCLQHSPAKTVIINKRDVRYGNDRTNEDHHGWLDYALGTMRSFTQVIQASGISSVKDVHPDVHAVIIGSALTKGYNPEVI